MELIELIKDLAGALHAVDQTRPVEGKFKPGIGPHTENNSRDLAIAYLRQNSRNHGLYTSAGPLLYKGTRKMCDLVIPGEWAVELKLLRPYGDNNKEAEHWSNKILHPYNGNTSAIGDVLKLAVSEFKERKAVILFGYEHSIPKVNLETTLKSFELIAGEVLKINLGERLEVKKEGLVHPVFQTLRVIGWQIKEGKMSDSKPAGSDKKKNNPYTPGPGPKHPPKYLGSL